MAFRSVGINLPIPHLSGSSALAEDLERLKRAHPDFVEVCPHLVGVILGGRLERVRMDTVKDVLTIANVDYTVHAPHRLNLMHLDNLQLQWDILEASVRFAGEIGAKSVVCHAGQRTGVRDARYSWKEQLGAERTALRQIGDIAGELGVIIVVENSYPGPEILNGASYAYAAWPSELAGQVAAVDHPAVGICLDVGHAAVASTFFGFDYLKECAVAAPLIHHVHLHDNLSQPDFGGEPNPSERLAYGLGDLHLPPGRGSIPLEELFHEVSFPQKPTCCVELPPSILQDAPEALATARKLGELSGLHAAMGRPTL